MDIVYKRCCGADIHKKLVVACCADEHGKKEIKSFGTMTDELLEFCGWLKEREIEMVAMESTGSYRKPIFNLLELKRARKGNSTLKKTLVQCARSVSNNKNTYLNSMYRRIASRRGKMSRACRRQFFGCTRGSAYGKAWRIKRE